MVNPRISLIISLLSGVGFVMLLAIAPTKDEKQHDTIPSTKQRDKPKRPALKNKKENEQSILNTEKDNTYFAIQPKRKIKKLFEKDNSYTSMTGFYYSINNLNNQFLEPFFLFKGENTTFYSDSKINFIGTTKRNFIGNHPKYNMFIGKDGQFYEAIPPNSELKRFEINYKLNSSVSAVMKTSSFDMYDERFGTHSVIPMVGFNFSKGEKISTKITAGDSYSTSLNSTNIENYLYGYYNNPVVLQNREDKLYFRVFEWQTNVQATKNLAFQTSIYNSWRDNNSISVNSNNPEGARLAVSYGLKFIVLNLKYNYNSNYMFKGFKPPSEDSTASDYAGFGFTLFIDAAHKYAIYIGNNYYNLVTNNLYNTNSLIPPTTTSFVASLRGQNSQFFNTTFFINFKNYYYKNYYYTNIGLFRLNTLTKEYSEYSTSMGLELSF